jgi:hypothetical protein
MDYKMKRIIFAGCSFTYGHGLWQYTKEEGMSKDDVWVSPKEFPVSLDFMRKNRFPRLVSKYFGTLEVIRDFTSGSDKLSLEFVPELLRFNTWEPKWAKVDLDFSEISHLVFQTSYLDRCSLIKDGKEIWIGDLAKVWKNYPNISPNVKEFWTELKITYYNKIRDLFLFLEDKGIKCYMLAITDDYFDLIKNDEFIKSRFIDIEYNGTTFKNFGDLFEFDKKLMIINDTDNFEDPPKDFHPSLKCHRIVANSIIKKLESDLS